ncbi:SIS domain-containing protein [Streptomyces armeniacus]|uniref:SIS domain-containing protein n=1 Tax=Streptomyces armeniacus TaxID=83291 RepID=A0A345XJ34_9ACTN|nr:SIS domain-containing protein [Streptomyces armeniacus]AXK31650.1 SIS domain-containing protein [Streptomyces armeniacus]
MHDALTRQLADHLDAAEGTRALLPALDRVARDLIDVYARDGRLYTFGNGGSAADAQHLAAELIGRYLRERRPLAAVSLTTDPSVVSCIANDYDFDELFARQVRALARPGDMVIGFTTSGRSPNVVQGLAAARAAGAVTVLFGGGEQGGRPAAEHADHAVIVPATATARIQEMHLLLLHLLSERVDAWAAATDGTTGATADGTTGAPPRTTDTAPGTDGTDISPRADGTGHDCQETSV